jgi:hypothetical protein
LEIETGLNATAQAAGDEKPMAEFPRDAKPWLDLIQQSKNAFADYNRIADSIDKLYASLEKLSKEKADREFAMFWANLEVVKPSIYSRPPVPVVMPRFRDRREVPTASAEVLERTLISSFESDDLDDALISVRDDMAVNARGVVWMRYEAQQVSEEELKERVSYDHVDRHDFLHEPARKWSEVGWVARRSYIDKKVGRERFGDVFLQAELAKQKDLNGKELGAEKKAQVWEIWSKTENIVVWVTPGVEEVLDVQEPWLQLEKFFPCPRPAYSTLQRGSLVPIPDFLYYKDQIEEINELTARISALCESLKMKGFYQAGSDDIATAIETALKQRDNGAVLVPVSAAAAQTVGGSFKDAIVWLPVVEVATTIKELIAVRKQLIEDVYQITGLSDIMRGSTAANETATAQQLKSQYGSIRIKERQQELVRIARDITRIAGEIIAENFQPQTILSMSLSELPSREIVQQQMAQMQQQPMQPGQPPPQPPKPPVTSDDVIELLRNQRMRPYIMEIETDSTIQPDEDAEKQRRTEFLAAIGGFINQAMPLVQTMPEAAPLAAESLKFAAAGFRAGRSLESVIDEFAETVKKVSSQPKPPPPEQVKAEADAKAKEADLQFKTKSAEADFAIKQQQSQADTQIRAKELEFKSRELDLKERELMLKERQAELEAMKPEPAQAEKPYESELAAAQVEKTYAEIDKIRAETAGGMMDRELKAQDSDRNYELGEKKIEAAKSAKAEKQKAGDD